MLAPKFGDNGLIPVVTTDFYSGELLMHGYMNEEALKKPSPAAKRIIGPLARGDLYKGATSGLVHIAEMRIDDDQDCVWLRVQVGGNGAGCHVGYRSCFYRSLPTGELPDAPVALTYEEDEKSST